MTRYLVFEMQTDANGHVVVVDSANISTFDDLNAAESKYHLILSYAAMSQVPTHAAVIIDNYGNIVMQQAYTHFVIDEPSNNSGNASAEPE